MKLHPLLLAALMVLLLGSCRTTKDVPYLIDADKLPQSVLDAAARMKEPIVMAGDMLQINVSGPDADAVLPFNKTGYMTAAGNVNTTGMNSQDNSMYHYLVDNEGCIEFPLVGKLHVGGMTMSQVQELIASQIYPKYLTVLPTVEARI
ncbi:MAG: polysaccharide biosynthesis/export family protein, partial [Muribaculaceae bacterium]|nr:polysaccharide biosynthesis/export family protein [Muribaculaceae bacterium]